MAAWDFSQSQVTFDNAAYTFDGSGGAPYFGWDFSYTTVAFSNASYAFDGSEPTYTGWDFSDSFVTFDNPGYKFDGSEPGPTGGIITYLEMAPQANPSVIPAQVWASAEANPQGLIARFVFAAPQADPTQIAPRVWRSIVSLTGALIWDVFAAPQADPTPPMQPLVYGTAQALQGAIVRRVSAGPQSIDLTIQPFVQRAATAPGAALVTQFFSGPQQVDLTLQGSFSAPLLPKPVVPGPAAPFFSTQPQFEERATQKVWSPLHGFGSTGPTQFFVPPQAVDLTTQGQVRGTAPGNHGRVPRYQFVQPPQQDFGVQPLYVRPLARLHYTAAPQFFSGPQLVDLNLQPWVSGPQVNPGGAVPPYLFAQPPQQDLNLQPVLLPSSPNRQATLGTTPPTFVWAPPQQIDFNIQPVLIPDDSPPPASYEYAYTLITITSLDQLPFNAAQTTIIENSACVMDVAYFSLAGTPLVPSTSQYRVDDLATGVQIVGWTTLVPAATQQVVITAAQNALISNSRPFEVHQFMVQIVDGAGNTYNAKRHFTVRRVPGFPGYVDPPCLDDC